MAGEATVKNDNELLFVGLATDGSVRRYDKREDAPEGTMIFTSIEEVGKLTIQDLDKIAGTLLKAPIPASKHKDQAVDRAWTAMMAASAAPPPEEKKSTASRAPRVGNAVFKLLYDFDHPGKAEDKFKELPPQAQVCLKIMGRGGKKEYPEAELRKLVEEHSKDLATVQEPWRIFQYYRRRLSDDKFIQAA